MIVTPDSIEYYSHHKIAIHLTKSSERILIGTDSDIQTTLEGGNADLFYDQVQPLGSLFLSLTYDPDWENVLKHLNTAHQIMSSYDIVRYFVYKSPAPYESLAQEILDHKRNTENPLYIYIANRIWYGYWPLRDKKKATQYFDFMEQMKTLIRPFSFDWKKLAANSRVAVDDDFLNDSINWRQSDNEIKVRTVPNGSSTVEYLITCDSVVPLIKYYGEKLKSWKTYSITCKVCGKQFVATNLHHKLCSDLCRQRSREERNTIRLQDDITRTLDNLCHTVDATWNNRLRKIRNLSNWSEEDVRNYEIAKEHYQEKKKKMRKKFKYREIPYSEFCDWLFKQQCYAEELIQEHNKK